MRAFFYGAVAFAAAALFLILPLLILLMHAARAGVVEVRPTTLSIGPSQQIAILSLENHEARDAIYQVSLFRWRQDGDEQTLDPTTDLIASPPMVTIPPDGTQTIRVGLRGQDLPPEENAYRLILEEVPDPDRPKTRGLNINLRLSLPVFVRPVDDLPPAQLGAALRLDGSHADVAVHNSGLYTARIVGASLKLPGADAGKSDRIEINRLTYIQPGHDAVFAFTLPALPQDMRHAAVTLQTDAGEVALDAMLVEAAAHAPAPPQR